MKILVSACLLGERCRYDGMSKPESDIIALEGRHELIPVCPEVLGGLQTPRAPAEICGSRVINSEGKDVTAQYSLGAQKALEIALENGCTLAILKEKSPSCGKGRVYDGSFSRSLKVGDGITAALLISNGITVIGESEKDIISSL